MTTTHVAGEEGPLVSILTPSFNQAEWLSDNLRSVACQTYGAIEHVVMDGGSTDGSVGILEAAGETVRWRSESDKGQADAINKAFRESRGEIIGWINSDDAYFDCGVVEAVVAFFAEHPEVDVVYGHGVQTTQDGAIIQVFRASAPDATLLRTVDTITQPTAFIRRRVLADPMLDDSYHFAMDYELWLRLESSGSRFARIDRFIAIDRQQAARKSSTIKDVLAADLQRLAATYATRFGPEWDSVRSRYYVTQRIVGALLIPRIKGPLAFSHPHELTRGLLRRQLLTRKSHWPAEYR
jgi:glycosyltransferase involved in cell wall biosynthesis